MTAHLPEDNEAIAVETDLLARERSKTPDVTMAPSETGEEIVPSEAGEEIVPSEAGKEIVPSEAGEEIIPSEGETNEMVVLKSGEGIEFEDNNGDRKRKRGPSRAKADHSEANVDEDEEDDDENDLEELTGKIHWGGYYHLIFFNNSTWT